MKSLVELFIAALELIEAEGRELRREGYRLGESLGKLFIAVILAAAGILLVASAVILAVQTRLGLPGALALCGGILLVGAGFLWWTVKKDAR